MTRISNLIAQEGVVVNAGHVCYFIDRINSGCRVSGVDHLPSGHSVDTSYMREHRDQTIQARIIISQASFVRCDGKDMFCT